MTRKKTEKVVWRLTEGNYSHGGIRFTPGAGISFPRDFDPNDHFAGSTWELWEEEKEKVKPLPKEEAEE